MKRIMKCGLAAVLALGILVPFASAAVKSIKTSCCESDPIQKMDMAAGTDTNSQMKMAPTQIKEFTIVAKRYEFNPAEIRVKQGDTVRITLAPKDATHGFMIKEYGINISAKKGETSQVEFLADKTGTFVFRCSHFCGLGHFGMQGKLIVE